MDTEKEKSTGWDTLEELANDAISLADNNITMENIIMKRLEQEDATDVLLNKNTIGNMAEEIIKTCKQETLPTQPDPDNETVVKKFWTLTFPTKEQVECYCLRTIDDSKIKGECTFLAGGTLDRDYYIALAHELSTRIEGHRGIVITARFDPNIKKTSMIVPLLTLWDLYRMLARLEGIEIDAMLPVTINNTPTHHSNTLIIKNKKEHKEILADIGNTILTIWPRFLEIALGPLGRYMPLEIHITIPLTEFNKYAHASTKLTDFREEGVHKHITYPGVYNKHRNQYSKTFKVELDHAPGIIPNIREKTAHIVDLIKAAQRAVNSRIIELAAAGVKLNQTKDEQVKSCKKIEYILPTELETGDYLSIKAKLKKCKELTNPMYLADRGSGEHGNLSIISHNWGGNQERKRDSLTSTLYNLIFFHWIKLKPYMIYKDVNITIKCNIFFRIKMGDKNNGIFSSQKRKTKDDFPPNSPMLTLELAIATDWIGKFQEYIEDLREEDNTKQLKEIMHRYVNRTGIEEPPRGAEPDIPFTQGQDMGIRKLPKIPREGERYMPKGIRLEWGNLQEEKQESFIGSLLAIIPSLTTGEKARIHTIRQGGDSNRTKEIQYREPHSIEQFSHIGLINNLFQYKDGRIENLPFAPLKIHLDINIAGNSIDREYIPYSIAISIRNLTIPHKGQNNIEDLVNETFPALNGARVANWCSKTHAADENGETIKAGLWYTVIHGKMAEWIFLTGKVALRNSQPLKNQICFEEYQMNLPIHCTQCQRWGDHRAYEAGLAGCSAPGYCQYCGQGTSRTLYKQHEIDCKITNEDPICSYCKRDGINYNHSSSNPQTAAPQEAWLKG